MSPYQATSVKRWSTLGFVLLSAVILSCANVRTLAETPAHALEVARADLDPQTLAVNIDLANHGTRAVAAYGITIVTHYANGAETANHTIMDISHALVSESVFGSDPAFKPGSKPFRPGDSRRHHTFATRNETGSPVVSVDAFITTEVFADGTARGPAEEIARIRQIWKQELDENRKWLPDLIQLRSSKSAAQDIQRVLARLNASDSGTPGAHDAGSTVRSTLKRSLTSLSAAKTTISSPEGTGTAKLVEMTEARATLLAHMLGEDRKGGKQ